MLKFNPLPIFWLYGIRDHDLKIVSTNFVASDIILCALIHKEELLGPNTLLS